MPRQSPLQFSFGIFFSVVTNTNPKHELRISEKTERREVGKNTRTYSFPEPGGLNLEETGKKEIC